MQGTTFLIICALAGWTIGSTIVDRSIAKEMLDRLDTIETRITSTNVHADGKVCQTGPIPFCFDPKAVK
jgi:hypothetical protein